MALATVLPIGIHELMLSGFGVPYPSTQGFPSLIIDTNAAVSALTLLFALHYTSEAFTQRPLWIQCAWVSLVASAIMETSRVVFMNGMVTTAYAFNVLTAIPFILCRFALFSGVTVIARLPLRALLKAALAVALFALFAQLEPWLEHVLDLEMRFANLSHAEVYAPPYGWAVNVPSTITFVEPVLGLLGAYGVMRDTIGSKLMKRLLAFAVLVLLFRKPLFAALFYGVYSPMGYLGFIYAESQFILEWIVAAVLAAMTYEWATSGQRAS